MDNDKPAAPQHDSGMNWIALPDGGHVTVIPSIMALHQAWAGVVAWLEARVAELEGRQSAAMPEPAMEAPEPEPEPVAPAESAADKPAEPFNPPVMADHENDGA